MKKKKIKNDVSIDLDIADDEENVGVRRSKSFVVYFSYLIGCNFPTCLSKTTTLNAEFCTGSFDRRNRINKVVRLAN